MNTQWKNLPRGQVEIILELTPEDYEPFLKQAAHSISEKILITGFRPGKVPYEMVKKTIGEAKLWEEALEPAVKKTLSKAIQERNIAVVGSPSVDIVKLAPHNPVMYKAVLNLLPTVAELNLNGISTLARKEMKVEPKNVEKSLYDLQKIYGKRNLEQKSAENGDEVEVNFQIFIDHVPIENGSGKGVPMTIGENKFIPGFEEKLLGMKEGEEKKFQLVFPHNYYQKNIAGKFADFDIEVLAVYRVELPEANDIFAKSLRFENFSELKKHIEKNLLSEAQHKEETRIEDEIINTLIKNNRFSDIPDILIQSEAASMLEELEKNIQNNGLHFDDYLLHLRKTRNDLLLDFTPTANRRIKLAILFREIARQNTIFIGEEEFEEALKDFQKKGGKEARGDSAGNKEDMRYLRNFLTSKKVMGFLKGKMSS